MASDVLHLILQKKYFDQILKGEKIEEYRAYSDFYVSKLCTVDDKNKQITGIRKFKYGLFQLGYSKTQMKVEIEQIICEGEANEDQQMIPEKTTFIIKIKSILERPENYNV